MNPDKNRRTKDILSLALLIVSFFLLLCSLLQ